MKKPLKKIFSTDLNKSLLATLIRYFPPIEFNEALIDVVNVLMDGLSRGDVYIDMKKTPENLELKYKDWPSYHMKALLESCLLYTSPSPRDGLLSRMPSSA